MVVGRRDELVALSLEDGAVAWRSPVDGLPRGLAVDAGTLYVGTLAGRLIALPRVGGDGAASAARDPRSPSE